MRDGRDGHLRLVQSVTREEQLRNPANFVENGKLYLVRCMSCGPVPRGRENYMMCVANGECGFCGWADPGKLTAQYSR